MTYDLSFYREKVRALLTEKRYNHTLCVEKEAVRLAGLYGADEGKAALAAVLHDSMKCCEKNEMLGIIDSHRVPITEIERENKSLWHAKAGYAYARDVLKITDEDVLNAILYHTTGRAGMSLLEKIVYCADCISADRDYEGIEEARSAVKISLENLIVYMQKYEILRLIEKNSPVCILAIECYNDNIKKIKGAVEK